jgi:hypothetical protein
MDLKIPEIGTFQARPLHSTISGITWWQMNAWNEGSGAQLQPVKNRQAH